MSNLLDKKDFEVINTLSEDILFYSPNSQLFPLKDPKIKEYMDVCIGLKEPEFSFLKSEEMIQVNKYLNIKFKESPQPNQIRNPIKTKLHLLILPISGKCNLQCTYCFARVDGKFSFNDLNTSEAKNIIDYLFKRLNLKELEILFFGGEPFLKTEIMSFIINYINNNYEHKKIRYSVTTNGTILNNQILNIIKQNDISVLISIDGPKENENYRIFPNGKSSFTHSIKNIQKLKEEGIKIGLRGTITNTDLQIVNIYKFFENLEIPFKIVFAHKSENKDHNLADFTLNLKSINNQYNDLIKFYIGLISNSRKIHCLTIIEKLKFILLRTKIHHACSGGRAIFSITSSGYIYSCEHLAGIEKYSVGNIVEGIDQNMLSQFQSIDVDKIDECQHCWVRYCCAGGCFADNISSTGNSLIHEKNKCELIKAEYKFIIALYYEINKKFPKFFKLIN